jgi:hypothetical protein
LGYKQARTTAAVLATGFASFGPHAPMLPEAGFRFRLAANELHVPFRIDKLKEKLILG